MVNDFGFGSVSVRVEVGPGSLFLTFSGLTPDAKFFEEKNPNFLSVSQSFKVGLSNLIAYFLDLAQLKDCYYNINSYCECSEIE